MRTLTILVLAAICTSPAYGAPKVYQPPAETARLAPGSGVAVAQAQCAICHSVDYITTQPRTFADPKSFWSGEVTKMKKAYGAVVQDADAQTIVDYLASAYGRDSAEGTPAAGSGAPSK